ncbi:MAG TPA: hypothetical protein VJH63_01480 [Candidatus Paceibacterota bacterium]
MISDEQKEKSKALAAAAVASLKRSPQDNTGGAQNVGGSANVATMVGSGPLERYTWAMPMLITVLFSTVFGWLIWLLGPTLASAMAGGNEKPLTRWSALLLVALFGTVIWVSALFIRQVWRTKKL